MSSVILFLVISLLWSGSRLTSACTALEVTGHEQTLIVGQTAVLTCSTQLDATKMEWIIVGLGFPVATSYTQEVVLTLELSSTGLDGAMFTCMATTAAGNDDCTVSINVKELEHTLVIEAPDVQVEAGKSYNYNCIATSDITPLVKWMGPDNTPISGDGIVVGDPVINETHTILSLSFNLLRTSHGGKYTCTSVVQSLQSVQTVFQDLIVKIPSPTVTVTHYPDDNVFYTTTQLNMTCDVEVDEAVDTGVSVSTSWKGPSGELTSNSRVTISEINVLDSEHYQSEIMISSLQSSDSGNYTCAATISPNPSAFVQEGNSSSDVIQLSVELKVTINIQYTPPSDVSFRPPNYRPATPVTLTCEVEGATGTVSYLWTSSCSSCFVSGTSQSVSRSRLFSTDAGVHTCTVSDWGGNTGSASTDMNIIGAGIYVEYSDNVNSAAVPHNAVIVSRSYGYPFHFYCQSNSTSHSVGSITGDYSSYLTRRHCGAGCYRAYRSSWSYSYRGVYTCRIPDSTGTYLDVNVGLYQYGFNSPPRVTSFQHTSSTTRFTLSCYSTDSPATSVTWVKDGTNLTIDGTLYQLTQTVTYRRYSRYTNTLMSTDSLDNVVGNHTCIVSNIFGSSSRDIEITGLQITGNDRPLIIGERATLICSSDLHVSKIEWFAQNDGTSTLLATSTSSTRTLVFSKVSLNMHGAQYTCRVTSPYGTQERNITVTTEVPDGWATVEVNSTTEPPTEGHDFGLVCTVALNLDLNADPTLEWLGPDGTPVLSDNNITVGIPIVDDNVTSLTLFFTPLNSSHGGEYTCRATVSVPKLNVTRSKTATRDLIVTSQLLFQLKIGPLKDCIQWTVSEARRIEFAIKEALRDAINKRCSCGFQMSAIDNGEFSCETMIGHVVYRSKINGTTDRRTAKELLVYIEDWITSEGTFLLDDVFRLRVSTSCPLRIQSVHQPECLGDTSKTSCHSSMGKCFKECVAAA